MAVKRIQFTKIELQIVTYLFKHYKDKYNARQLAKFLKINHAHANKLCHLLVDKHLLTQQELGNSIFFSYNYEYPLAIKFMEYTLSLEDFPSWLKIVSYNLNKFKDCIGLGLIFGSSIKSRDFNDIDILLMYDPEKSKEIKKIKDEIRKSELVEKPIRYVDITEADILLNKKDKIFYNIFSENLVFHNPEKYVEVIQKSRT
ncbi:hypothetical protein COV20_01315 [Candidatus Woesearchaeota archaeon CG10_big_fil_rev_8_21_14_0_10_45_16]|nr:MAG: hypothetical protein COV20_01315 [Candidatus Woesearchaeota archaeon CG10_big_fil_rev_8_21_14_0_10_45_16]